MSKTAISFRARARTIDHLGKGQIADCPTAVSELWKNSYDAYARNVALHTFDGAYKCGAIIDNGCGMTMTQLIESWLVIGTDSKSTKKTLPLEERFGLSERKTQGEKGIGRLSSAFLAPVTLLISKKINSDFTVALIDWRLFENPYLSLSDITVPIDEFQSIEGFAQRLPLLLSQLKDNLCLTQRLDITNEKFLEIQAAWDRFSHDQLELSQQTHLTTTRDRISQFCDNFLFDPDILQTWERMLGAVEVLDGGSHGTALFLLDLDRELALLTNSDGLSRQNFEVEKIEHDLVDTLRAFVDPFDFDESEFQYEIKVFSKESDERTLLRQTDVFNLTDFSNLEHVVRGRVDDRGWFVGTVKAFGKDKGIAKISPNIEIDLNGTKVGPFEINLGTFENEADKSSHTDSEFSALSEQTNKYTGLMIFRDGLRVLPYGRADNDFFEIEERRGKNAGRYYWARRRLFGQILITQSENAQLKDKAGREGFIKNRAARELRAIVEDILVALADRYFGKKADDRIDMLAIVKKEREARKEAQTKARAQSLRSFLTDLRRQEPELAFHLESIKKASLELRSLIKPNVNLVSDFEKMLNSFESARSDLRTPIKPPKLGDNEDRYRSYRDMYGEFTAYVSQMRVDINKFESSMNSIFPGQAAKRKFDSNQAILNSFVTKQLSQISLKVEQLMHLWEQSGRADRALYYEQAIDIVENANAENLEVSLNSLDATYENLIDSFNVKYSPLLRALDRLESGVNLDSAFSMAEEERFHFEKKAKDLQALAQLGISVEILSHELETLDSLVTSGLNSLPSDIKQNHPGYKTAFNAHKGLTQQIRFLSPLKLSGYQLRRDITGTDIKLHVENFFADRFSRQRVQLSYGDKFLGMRIKDLPSRIYPVFVNIINNALYWVSLSETRSIKIDIIENEVVIANSGPPIDEDDIPRLFELFYSKRANGHGVGLYLCKENLAVAHHKIRYAEPGDSQLISNGANFIITFNGMEISS